jgi:hypothetical protein
MEFDYTVQEWAEDWAAIAEATPMKSKESSQQYFRELFQSRYTKPGEAYWKLARIGAAYDYLGRNLDSFLNSGWGMQSSKGIDIFPHLLTALYRAFTIPSDAVLSHPPPPEVIIAAAEEQRRVYGP